MEAASPCGRWYRYAKRSREAAGPVVAKGSFKVVYLAFDREFGREVAWNVVNLEHTSATLTDQVPPSAPSASVLLRLGGSLPGRLHRWTVHTETSSCACTPPIAPSPVSRVGRRAFSAWRIRHSVDRSG